MALDKRHAGMGMRDFGLVLVHGKPYGMFVRVQRRKREKNILHPKKKKKEKLFQFHKKGIQIIFFNREQLFVLPLVILSYHVRQIVKLHTGSTEIPIRSFLFKQNCHWFQWQLCLIKENWIEPWSNGVLSLSLLFWPLTITFKELEAIVAPAVFQVNKQKDKKPVSWVVSSATTRKASVYHMERIEKGRMHRNIFQVFVGF